MKRILVIYTGGTICTKISNNVKSTDRKAAFALPEFYKKSNSPFKEEVAFENGDYFGILSENMTVEKWNKLIAYFLKEVLPNIERYDGIIIAHGTDTLAYSAALFSLLLKGISIPVFFVSSNEQLQKEKEADTEIAELNEKANGNINFQTAVECICRNVPAGVYVPYKNIDEDKVRVHFGERIEQCKIYSENFYSFDSVTYCKNIRSKIEKKGVESVGRPLLIERCKEKKLKDCVLKIEPYVGLNYSRFSFRGVQAILHSTYHSGTACVEKDQKKETKKQPLSQSSILRFIDRCSEKGIPFYYAPCNIADDAEMYDTVPTIKNHKKGSVQMLYGMTTELLYAKLIIAYSLDFSEKERAEFLKVSNVQKVF